MLITVIIVILSLSACDLNPIVNKLNGNEAAAKAQQEKEKYTELADGTYLYKQSGVSTENKIQFIDEENNVGFRHATRSNKDVPFSQGISKAFRRV